MFNFYLYVVSFYYAMFIPKPTWGPDRSEEIAIGLVLGTFFHVLLVTSFFYFLEWPKGVFGISPNDSFFELMVVVGIPLSIWIVLGWLHYPMLIEKSQEPDFEAQEKENLKNGIDNKRRIREIEELAELRKTDRNKYEFLIYINVCSWNSKGVFVDDYEIFHHGGYLERALKEIEEFHKDKDKTNDDNALNS